MKNNKILISKRHFQSRVRTALPLHQFVLKENKQIKNSDSASFHVCKTLKCENCILRLFVKLNYFIGFAKMTARSFFVFLVANLYQTMTRCVQNYEMIRILRKQFCINAFPLITKVERCSVSLKGQFREITSPRKLWVDIFSINFQE